MLSCAAALGLHWSPALEPWNSLQARPQSEHCVCVLQPRFGLERQLRLHLEGVTAAAA